MDQELRLSSDGVVELVGFTLRLRDLAAMCPYSVTSWRRTVRHNVEVGGSPRSLHLDGLAVDCVPDKGVSKEALFSFVHKAGLYGVIEADHVHVQARPAKK